MFTTRWIGRKGRYHGMDDEIRCALRKPVDFAYLGGCQSKVL